MSMWRTEDLGELFFMGLDEGRWTSALEKRLRTRRPGGIILAPRNLLAVDSTADLLGRISPVLGFHPFLALEEEGGAVDPLRKIFPPLPSPQTVSQRGHQVAMKLGELSGAGMKLLGFNTNFAPRLDFPNPMDKTSHPAQSFGSDHQTVTRCGAAFVRGLQRHNVIACGKYFPGTGDARPDVDTGFFLSSKPMARMWREDLVPYLQLLRQLPMVMVSHRAYKAYDFDLAVPAVLSRNVLEGLLRVKLGYHGVALVDDTLKESTLGTGGLVKSFTAGADMAVVRGGEKTFTLATEDLQKALELGTITDHRIGEALKRIRRVRKNVARPIRKFSRHTYERLCSEFEDFNQEFRTAE
jgi:beta-N-acetylhexosaminidase